MFRIVLLLAAGIPLVTVTSVSAGNVIQVSSRDVPGSPTMLTVLIHDYSQLSAKTIRGLEEFGEVLLSRAGIRVQWAECIGPRVDLPPEPCMVNLDSRHIAFRILASCPVDAPPRCHVLGSAEVSEHYGSLCADQIVRAAEENGLDPGIVAAYALAHEIGHLLLGPGHANSGIMRHFWREAEHGAMRRLWLDFSRAQAEQMRVAVSNGGGSGGEVAGR